ncbi:MAG TPA: GGDEF-domain containing protein, partial [Thermodesulfobacteriota bacterium]|nr:GGDEF-domain containing protein [Thermodesulfobacteriota bacterium]
MPHENLKLYSLLSRLPFPKSYLGKIMLLVFVGTHVPLLSLIFYFTLTWPIGYQAVKIIVITLIATLVGTAFALYLLYSLLSPVSLTSEMLREYINEKKMPNLPTDFQDQVGRLMADVQYT